MISSNKRGKWLKAASSSIIAIFLLIMSFSLVTAQSSSEQKIRGYLIEVSYSRPENELNEIQTTLSERYLDSASLSREIESEEETAARFNLSLISFNGRTIYQRQWLLPLYFYDVGYVNSTTESVFVPYYANAEKAVLVDAETGVKQLEIDLKRFADKNIVKNMRPSAYKKLYADLELSKDIVEPKDSYHAGQQLTVRLTIESDNQVSISGTLSDNNNLKGVAFTPETNSYEVNVPPNSEVTRQYILTIKEVNYSGLVAAEDRDKVIEKEYDLNRASFSAYNTTVYSNKPTLRVSNRESKEFPFNLVIIAVIALSLLTLSAFVVNKYFNNSQQGKMKGMSLVVITITVGTVLVLLALLIVSFLPQIDSVQRSMFGQEQQYRQCLQDCRQLQRCEKAKEKGITEITLKDYRQECAAYHSCELTKEVVSTGDIDLGEDVGYASTRCGKFLRNEE